MTEHTTGLSDPISTDEHKQIKFPLVMSLFITSIIVFLITAAGITDDFSRWISNWLLSELGYTNKWSKTYGPEWFFNINRQISALAGPVFIALSVLAIAGYYFKTHDRRRMWRFLIIVIGGGIFLIVLKEIFSADIPVEMQDSAVTPITNFPSGHATMATIFYLTVAIYLTRKNRGKSIRQYFILFAVFLILIIGLSRILSATHSFTEVIAGWSAGLVWLCICWLTEHFARSKGW